MRIIIINGSPRVSGITATTLHMLEKELKGNGMEIEFFNLSEIEMSHCLGCCSCYKTGHPGGRAAILTFHSGEDRLVKKAFKELHKEGIFSEISADVIRPSAEECRINPRSKSTKMRWAVKA